MRRMPMLYLCLLSLVTIIWTYVPVSLSEVRTQGTLTPMQHTLVTPLALVPGFSGAQLAVANRTDSAIPAVVDFVDENGGVIVSVPITMEPHQIQTLDFSSVLRGADLSSVRSITVNYYGVFRSLASQVELLGFNGGGSADATPYENIEFYSPDLNAVWWSPKGSTAYVAITNSSENTQTVTVNIDTHPTVFSIPPRGTVLRELPADQSSREYRSAHIHSSASNGVIRATAFVATSDGTYINTLRFVDPGVLMSGSLAATGIILKDGSYVLPVVNLTSKEETISGQVYLRSHSKTSHDPVPIIPVVLRPGEIETVALDSARVHKEDIVAVKLNSSGGPGSFLASLTVLYPKTPLLSSSVPFRDVATEEMATGGYPWVISGDYKSIVFLTNTTSQKKTAFVRLFPSDGSEWVPPATVLQPGETVEYNIRKIRDEQVPDGFGHTLNKAVSMGQFIWGIDAHSTDDNGLLGRTVMESVLDKTLRSYSCYVCSCGYSVTSLSVNPYQFTVAQGSTFSFQTIAHYTSPCLANSPYTSPVAPEVLDVNNPPLSVVSRGVTSTILGVSGGSSNFGVHYPGGSISFNEGSCPETYYDVSSGGQATVSPSSTIAVNTSGSLSAGDNLVFGSNSCMHTLGFEQCPSLWGINVEVVGKVPDNVTNWNINQYVLSALYKGNFRNISTGALTPFNIAIPTGSDGPLAPYLQKINGTTTMYYVDDPGIINGRYGSSNNLVIDSATMAVNYQTKLCNVNQPNACTISNWYIRVVVDPGGQLDRSQSSAGPGSTPLNF